jgi:hypothetical protein
LLVNILKKEYLKEPKPYQPHLRKDVESEDRGVSNK